MHLRSQSTETVGFRLNLLPDQSGRPAGGRRFKFPKLWGGQRGQAAVKNTPKTDGHSTSTTEGHPPPREEEHQKGILTFKQLLEARHFSEASQLLIETEERLFGEIREEKEAFEHHKGDIDKLAADCKDLKDQLLQTLRLSLTPGEVSVDALTSAVKVIEQEEDQDQRWTQRDQTPPAWRPSGWKELHNTTLRTLVEERMDNSSAPPADHGQRPSIQADIHTMGRQLMEDLLLVVEVVKNCYPSQMDICNFYARLYHQSLSARLRAMAELVLEDKDCTFLLRWVNEFYPEILQKPSLASDIDTKELGKLLPKDSLEPLEEQYLSKQQDELMTYIGRVLKEEEEMWRKGEEPAREDGCFVSPVAYDTIQFINGMVTSAEKVVGDRRKAQNITCQLYDLMQRFRTFHSDIMKQDKLNSRPFVKANLGCIEQFSDVLQKQSHLFPEDVREYSCCILSEMKQSAHRYLLKPVHEVLKPHYRKLGTSDWLNKPLFEKLLVSIEQELQDLQGSTESCHQELIGRLHQEVTAEYVKRLLKGEIKLKDKERQLRACATVKDNADSLHDLFLNMGSKEDWLKDILTRIAELLKLQDLPAIQMQVAMLGTAFPDLRNMIRKQATEIYPSVRDGRNPFVASNGWLCKFLLRNGLKDPDPLTEELVLLIDYVGKAIRSKKTERHISALLKLKTNLSRADRKTVKETLSETLRETSSVVVRPFFSTVQVKGAV